MAYHDKRYPMTLSLRLTREQYIKVADAGVKGEVIRELINKYL